MKKQSELIRDIKEMIKETKAGNLTWDLKCQTTEYNEAETKPKVEEDGVSWIVDECFVSYYTKFRGEEFLMITYEMIHSAGKKMKTTNLVFLPPLGIRYFDLRMLMPYTVENDAILSYEIQTLWKLLLEEYPKNPDKVALEVSERSLEIVED